MQKIVRTALKQLAPYAVLAALFSVRSTAQTDLQQRITAAQQAQGARSSLPVTADAYSLHQEGPAMVPPHFAQLKLGPGFLLSLNVLDDQDFTGTFRVDASGDLVLPELGSIHVAGRTVPEAREEIAADLLQRGVLKSPQVELNVLEYTAPHVTILGAVASPGVFPLLAPEGLGHVLALAGDTTILAGKRIEITSPNRSGGPQIVHYSRGMDTKLLDSIVVQPGDTVHVTQAGVVYVLGGVNRPGGYLMEQNGDLSLLQAISIAGGTAITASIKWIYIMRGNRDKTTVWLKLPYRKMTEGKIADMRLDENDVVFVPTSRLKSAFMSSEGILASVSSASIYAGVIY